MRSTEYYFNKDKGIRYISNTAFNTNTQVIHVPDELFRETGTVTVTVERKQPTGEQVNMAEQRAQMNIQLNDDLANRFYGKSMQEMSGQLNYVAPVLFTPQTTMTRLTTSGDWTIAVNESNKLVAFDSKGMTIKAVGSLLSADGKAWMWKNGALWSGVLEQVLTETQKEEVRKKEEQERIYNKYQKKIEKASKKCDDVIMERNNELNKIR